MILSLKREVNALQNENEHLRSLLNLGRMPLESRSLLETSDGIGSKLSLSSKRKTTHKTTQLQLIFNMAMIQGGKKNETILCTFQVEASSQL